MTRIKRIVQYLTFFYLTVYIPFFCVAYLPGWYRLNCNWHSRCEKMGYDRVDTGIAQLNRFFRHQGELDAIFWTGKEKMHLMEVRQIADYLFLLFIAAIIGLYFSYHEKTIPKCAIINAALIVSFIAVIPFFATFWRNVFHPIVFDNQLWINTHLDFSFYIMPRQFFKFTTALLIISSSLINLLVWFGIRWKMNKNN